MFRSIDRKLIMEELHRELDSLDRDVQQGRLKQADLAAKQEEVRKKHHLKVLHQMFSNNDIGESVIFDVYSANKGKIGESIDTLLEFGITQPSQQNKNDIPTTVPTSQIQQNGTNRVLSSDIGQLHKDSSLTIFPSGYQQPKPISNSTEQVIYVNNTPNNSQDHLPENRKENYENGKESPVPIEEVILMSVTHFLAF